MNEIKIPYVHGKAVDGIVDASEHGAGDISNVVRFEVVQLPIPAMANENTTFVLGQLGKVG